MLTKILKWLCGLFVVILILLVCGIFLGNTFLPAIATRMVPKFTGYQITIEDPYVNLWRGDINFKGVRLTQEAAFPRPSEIFIHQAAVNIEMRSLLSPTKVLSNLTVDVEEVTLKRRLSETIDLQTLIGSIKKIRPDRVFEAKGKEPTKAEQVAESMEEKKASKQLPVMIRELIVRVDSLKAEVYMPGLETPVVVETPLMLDRTFQNVTDPKSTLKPVVVDVMKRSLGIMANAITKTFTSNLTNIGEGVGNTGKSLLGSLLGDSEESLEGEEAKAATEENADGESSGGIFRLF